MNAAVRSPDNPWAQRRPGRAVCPECAYPVTGRARGAAPRPEGRCPECGEAYPGPLDTRLRWGRQRLPIERRRHRPSWPLAWAQTALLVTFRPIHAAGRLAVPDRAGAAIGFAALSSLAAAILLSLHSAWAAAAVLQVSRIRVDHVEPGRDAYLGLSGWAIGLGWLCATGAWFVMMALAVAASVAVGNIVCDRRPAAFHAAARWACYSTIVFDWLAVLSLREAAPFYREVWATWVSAAAWQPPLQYHSVRGLWRSAADSDWWDWSDVSTVVWVGVAVYGAWCLLGLLASPHRERGRLSVALTATAAGAAVWFLLSQAAPWWALSLAVR